MSYQATTVADIIQRTNSDLFIPGIQRPYVWDSRQIVKLFDSLMQRYPISSFLFWQLDPRNFGDWEIYRFVEHFWKGDIHNDTATLAVEKAITLVLDGQQRLTSLLIGLRGSYTIKRTHARRANSDAWDAWVIHLDLAYSPDQEEDDEGNPLEERYRFKFFDESKRPTNKSGELWFEVGLIMEAPDESARDIMLTNWVDDNIPLPEELKPIARENLRRLWEMVWRDESIAYFTEQGQSYEKVLDIFIRANDGGTKLSRSDLLMSVITLRWQKFNARDEMELLIEEIAKISEPKRAITREYLLRSALYLADQDFSIRVKNFTPANIERIEQDWGRTKALLKFTATMLREQGLFGQDLSSTNVIMMLAYYIDHINRGRSIESIELADADIERIRRWVIVMTASAVFQLQTTALLSGYRTAVRYALRTQTAFPAQAVIEVFQSSGRFEGVNHKWIEKFCRTKDDEKYSHLLVSLLYPGYLPNLERRPVSLVQPRFFMPDELRLAWVPDAIVPTIQGYSGLLVLAVALSRDELVDYYDYPFEEWIKRLPDAFFREHLLPTDRSLYRMGRIAELAKARRVLLAEHFGSLFSTSEQVGLNRHGLSKTTIPRSRIPDRRIV